MAELTAEGRAKRTRLDAEVRARVTRATGLAEADTTKAKGLAEAEAIAARGVAEGTAIQASAGALSSNPEAVAMQALAEHWPAVVREAAGAFAHVQNFTVLDGAAGVNRALMEVAAETAQPVAAVTEPVDA